MTQKRHIIINRIVAKIILIFMFVVTISVTIDGVYATTAKRNI